DDRHVARIGHAAAHVDEEERVVRGDDLRVEDGLPALQHRDRLAVLADAERLRRQPRHRLAALPVDGEVDGDVPGTLDAAVDEGELQTAAAGGEEEEEVGQGEQGHGAHGAVYNNFGWSLVTRSKNSWRVAGWSRKTPTSALVTTRASWACTPR